MFYRLRRNLRTRRFDQQIRGVLTTPPIRVIDAPWTIVSMISASDVPMYLLSIKAFYRRMGGGRIVAIVGAELPQAQRVLLRQHVEGIEFEELERIEPGACQRGGTWERLVYCLRQARDGFVIQLDADVLAFGPDLAEALDCASRNVPFTMADVAGIVSMREAALAAHRVPQEENYVGIVAERAFERYPDRHRSRYVRGSSGFSGFAKGGVSPAEIEDFHAKMEALVGIRWTEWGTEQCGSNFAIANSPGAVVLPYPAYASFYPGGPRREAKCLHFIGRHRFDEDFLADRGREEILALGQESGQAVTQIPSTRVSDAAE